jgi:hypothetical protein
MNFDEKPMMIRHLLSVCVGICEIAILLVSTMTLFELIQKYDDWSAEMEKIKDETRPFDEEYYYMASALYNQGQIVYADPTTAAGFAKLIGWEGVAETKEMDGDQSPNPWWKRSEEAYFIKRLRKEDYKVIKESHGCLLYSVTLIRFEI